MELSLANFKAWLKADDDTADDANLALALAAAVEYFNTAADAAEAVDAAATSNLAAVAIFALAGHWAENLREAAAPVEFRELPLGVQNIINLVRFNTFAP